ncbi:thiolase family protein [Olsenella sp. AM30-3LB]|uniref:thiolase family protein n=1 Tax=Olsenella sp. AM30-3LB TaxID=2292359 RepID=UPI0025705505|nr:thiolase family protein [Olsenella sp. AM30-3LB]
MKYEEYQVQTNPLKPYSRGVSIIGVGATPFMHVMDDPETDGLCEGDLVNNAAVEAMKDAGLDNARQVDFFVHGQAGPSWQMAAETPAMHVANWIGMKGRGNCHHSEACCTGYVALEQAVSLVASGAYDIVLSVTCDMSYSPAIYNKPQFMRASLGESHFHQVLCGIYPRDYTYELHAAGGTHAELWLDQYRRENGLSAEQLDDVLCAMSKTSRRAAVLNPLSLTKQTYEEQAAEFGFDDVDKFLHSKFNPRVATYLRASNMELQADGAAAVVVCASDIAKQYNDHPIEVLGMGHSCLEIGNARLEKYATEAAYRQVRDLTGLTGKDMDLFMTNDFIQPSQFLSAEACEYLPRGEAWQYMLDGRTAYDADRPINTNGGRCNYGHAHGTSGMADIFETVKQMRGEAGKTQVKHPVKHAMLRGYGGGQNLMCIILEAK